MSSQRSAASETISMLSEVSSFQEELRGDDVEGEAVRAEDAVEDLAAALGGRATPLVYTSKASSVRVSEDSGASA